MHFVLHHPRVEKNRCKIGLIKKPFIYHPLDTPVDSVFTSDIVFLVDSSANVSRVEFQLEKAFVRRLMTLLNVSPGGSRTSLITYGDQARVVFLFDIYLRKKALDNAVLNATFVGGGRRMDKAISTAEEAFKFALPQTPKLLILLSSGRQEPGAGRLDVVSQPLLSQGVRTCIISIGENIDYFEIRPAVERATDILKVVSFYDLESQVVPTATKIKSGSCC